MWRQIQFLVAKGVKKSMQFKEIPSETNMALENSPFKVKDVFHIEHEDSSIAMLVFGGVYSMDQVIGV